MTVGSIGDWQGEEWLYFNWAADFMVDARSMRPGLAQARLRRACANGEIRSIVSEAAEEPQEAPQPIPPSRWRDEEVDHTVPSNYVVAVSRTDFEHWLDQQPKPLRGDYKGPWEADFYGERWLDFDRAAIELGDKLAIPPSAAEAKLRKLCASGEIRAIGGEEKPEPIPPSQWPDVIDELVMVSNIDFYNWLNRQPTQPTAGGKQSRIIRLLAEMFPTGVPHRGDRPREQLKAELIKRDPSLTPLDLKTLKTAIEIYNRVVGNARNTSVSD